MGKILSKGSPKEPEKVPEVKDNRWPLSRMRGPKYEEYFSKLREVQINNKPKRPIGNSTYWFLLPAYQALWFHIGLIVVFFRKLPFANPFARVLMVLVGIDLCKNRVRWVYLSNHDTQKYYQQFDILHDKLTRATTVRVPDFKMEWEDWYEVNKPAYRVPVPWEYDLTAWMRFYIMNKRKFAPRPVQWEGKWEQEISLNMDLQAPHADDWLSVH